MEGVGVSPGGGAGLSPSPCKRNRSAELLAAVEFVSDGSNAAQVVRQFSPCKAQARSLSPPQLPLQPALATSMLEALGGGRGSGSLVDQGPASPTAVADMPAAPSTASQPSSATSSLAAALADLQVSSRASSANDLGDRRQLLLAHQALALGAHMHSRSASGDELAGGSSGMMLGLTATNSYEESLCSPNLIGAVRNFDSLVLKTLTPIKTRSRATTAQEADGQPSPPAPYAESLVSPFEPVLKPKMGVGAGGAGRPMVSHIRSSSGMQAPGAYNPYDPVAAAMSTEFRSPAKSLQSPFPSSGRTASASATPSQWSASYRAAAYRNMAAQQALMQQLKEDEPDYYVSVPGVVRRSVSGVSASGLSSNGTSPAVSLAGQRQPSNSAAAAAAVAPGPASEPVPAPAQEAADRSPAPRPVTSAAGVPRVPRVPSANTLGSGTSVHGFKGLFRDIIMSPSSLANKR